MFILARKFIKFMLKVTTVKRGSKRGKNHRIIDENKLQCSRRQYVFPSLLPSPLAALSAPSLRLLHIDGATSADRGSSFRRIRSSQQRLSISDFKDFATSYSSRTREVSTQSAKLKTTVSKFGRHFQGKSFKKTVLTTIDHIGQAGASTFTNAASSKSKCKSQHVKSFNSSWIPENQSIKKNSIHFVAERIRRLTRHSFKVLILNGNFLLFLQLIGSIGALRLLSKTGWGKPSAGFRFASSSVMRRPQNERATQNCL